MTAPTILQQIKDSSHTKIKVAVTDIDGVLRGKYMLKEKFLSAATEGFGFCDVVYGWDAADELYDNSKITGWHTGYPDAPARVDLSTYRTVPWDNNVPFFLGDFSKENGEDFPACPRSLLKRIIGQCTNMGYTAFFAQEYEWFNFSGTPQDFHKSGVDNIQPLTPGMFGYSILRSTLKNEFFNDLFDLLTEFKVPLEGLHTETGPGVYEAAILYSEILEAADRATLFKTAVKEIAYKHGILATFMAKWNRSLPGSSGHVHQSLWDADAKNNLFFGKAAAATTQQPGANQVMSNMMKSYIAGQLHCMPHILPMIAPTVNSYKRLVEGAWAPTTMTWATDNRTTALRALPGSSTSTRLETRVVGADTNPYLAMAACLAAGLYGIKNNLPLHTPETIGNGYKDLGSGALPASLAEATAAMKKSPIARELFGEAFTDHFVRTREWEWKKFCQEVTDWEIKRYFEII